MEESRNQEVPVNLEDELQGSFLDYAMSVIMSRALPDVRDGLKPVQRRILYTMYTGGYRSNRPHNKSAKIVGEVMGKYHPHGDSAIYETLVGLAQPWSKRYMLVDGQGNFGSVDGDPPAAMRYTESRLTQIGEAALLDIEKDTVDFAPNYDGKELEPVVLPSAFPNLLVNGSQGIAVGMATNIPPHNLGECIDACVLLIDRPDSTLEDVLKVMPGPDFPTGGYIVGREGIREAYTTGRGKVTMRAAMNTEQLKGGREAIIVTELPYQVNKATLIQDIAALVRDKKLAGITDIRDESDRDGMRIVMEVRRGDPTQVIINNLYQKTDLQTNFGVILLAIVDNQPRYLSLVRMLKLFIAHRREVLVRGCRFDLARAEARLHIVEGLLIALANIDEVVKVIRGARDTEDAKNELIRRFLLSTRQADAILEMRLRTLTALEVGKLEEEKKELSSTIAELKGIIESEKRQYQVIRRDLLEVKRKFADARRSRIIDAPGDMRIEDLIPEERVVITISHEGYIKRTDLSLYRRQRRGGKGTVGAETKDEDWVEQLITGTTHDYLLIFTNRGMAHWLRVYELPEGGRATKGRPIINLLENLEKGEKIETVLPVDKFDAGRYLVFCTRKGQVARQLLSNYDNPRKVGLKAFNIQPGDELISVKLTTGHQEILLGSRKGMAIRFSEDDVRETGRFTQGVRGMDLQDGDYVVGMEVVRPGATILTTCEFGIGKRSPVDDYRLIGRGGKGVINIKITERSGEVVSINEVTDTDELIMITQGGQSIRFRTSDLRVLGRNTQGVRLFDLADDDRITAVSRTVAEDEDDEPEEGEGGPEE
jgi:DNA gyrase subunit A